MKLAEKPYQKEDDIYKMATSPGMNGSTSARASRQHHRRQITAEESGFVTLRVKDGVCDRFRADRGARPNVDTNHPDQRIQLFLTETTATLYIDSSGEPLWQRGLSRCRRAGAAQRESRCRYPGARWLNDIGEDGKPVYQTFLDPMCGSGTIVIEAAWMRTHTAPGLSRRFACEHWAKADKALWAKLRADARAAIKPLPEDTLFASDAHPGAIAATHRHLEQVGFADAVAIMESNLCRARRTCRVRPHRHQPTLWGTPQNKMRYVPNTRNGGAPLKQQFAGWTLPSRATSNSPKVSASNHAVASLKNGALDCRLFVIDLVAGVSSTAEAIRTILNQGMIPLACSDSRSLSSQRQICR